ncbi:hypothetical protein GUJ93_ZPchr0013g33995 [Zizania palustris]|uniref:Uncharacterized protein n=1 Tax=Zizania palustris TaxID=103762 RepID=A0A8J5WW12_ZIZPA|nr:hypothetical protein GUJ93_ZPchr0013g33995 [Zizania palustris]
MRCPLAKWRDDGGGDDEREYLGESLGRVASHRRRERRRGRVGAEGEQPDTLLMAWPPDAVERWRGGECGGCWVPPAVVTTTIVLRARCTVAAKEKEQRQSSRPSTGGTVWRACGCAQCTAV